MDLFSDLNELMVRHRFRPNKKMGQNFIIEEQVLTKMVEAADLSPKDTVLEIGAGTGFLTRELQKKCKVIAVELDDTLFSLLEQELPKKNLELVHGNFLDEEFEKFNKVVALPPYTISSAIIFRLFELKPELCIIVFQKEFAEKLVAQPGFMEYNALSVIAQYGFDIETLGRVPASSFFPKPNSDSSIVKFSLSNKNGEAKNEEAFVVFVKSIFRFQNKNLLNAVKNSVQFIEKHVKDKEALIKKVEKHKLAREKVNLLSCKQFVELSNCFF